MNRRAAIERLNFYRDPRVLSSMTTSYRAPAVDKGGNPAVKVSFWREVECLPCSEPDQLGPCSCREEQVDELLPGRFEVCDLCRGTGSTVNPSIDCGGLTADDLDRDPYFAESYMGGRFDVTCTDCAGRRVVAVVNENALDDRQKRIFEQLEERERWAWEDARERADELRMGC